MKAEPPALPVELMEEILLRLPPDEPAWLLRASLVCKSWGSAVSHRSFRRRLHELHGAPPVLGFLHNKIYPPATQFIPTTASSFSLAAPSLRLWRALDCRHGRALFRSKDQGELLVWEPITGEQQLVPVPAAFRNRLAAGAVVCAADGCDHIDCHGAPFRVVVVLTDPVFLDIDPDQEKMAMWACMYSSETATWGEPTSVRSASIGFRNCCSVLVGKSLLYFLSNGLTMLEYDMDGCGLALVAPPPFTSAFDRIRTIIPIPMEDGGLGVAEILWSRLILYSRQASNGSDAGWVMIRSTHLNKLLPTGALGADERDAQVVAYAEGANAVFVNTINGLFTIELQSDRARKVCDDGHFYPIAVVSFYTPVPRGEHQDLLKLNPSEEAANKERRTVEKKAIAIEEGDSANPLECRGGALKIRVPCCGEVAAECSSTVYNGCAFGSSAEDSAPPSEKGDCAEEASKKNPSEEAASEERRTVEKKAIAIEEGDSANALECVGGALKIRVLCSGEVALECSSMVYKHGCASGSSAEDSAPPSEKCDCAEGKDSNGCKNKH